MNEYYYSENNQKLGPFTLEEIRSKRLNKSTLVWNPNLPNWVKAENVDELKSALISVPPPLPSEKPISATFNFSYITDSDQQPNYSYASTGFILLAINIAAYIIYTHKYEDKSGSYFFPIYTLCLFAIRIIASVKLAKRAKEDLRSPIFWSLCGFLVPGITLLFFGLLKPLKFAISFDENDINETGINQLLVKGNDLYARHKVQESLAIALRVIEISKNNVAAHGLAAQSYMAIDSESLMNHHFQKIKEIENNRNSV